MVNAHEIKATTGVWWDLWILFAILAVACGLLVSAEWFTRSNAARFALKTPGAEGKSFAAFQRNYICVWLIMMGADWIQGPYFYALYASYGFNMQGIGQLFVAGYAASMVLGVTAGPLADRYGRRTCCIAFGILYSLSCITKYWSSFEVLLFGRLLGGIATSLLHSVFEAWMIATHSQQGFSTEQLSDTFTKAYFGNYVVAIAAGLLGSGAVGAFGVLAPFELALLLLLTGTGVIVATWNENYGDTTVGTIATFKTALTHMRNPKLLLLAACQALFESTMYTFVFMWTPQLEAANTTGIPLPHGLVFAVLMVSCMIGANCVQMLRRCFPAGQYMQGVFGLAAVGMLPSVLGLGFWPQLYGFCVFEGCVGVYFPTWGSIRSQVVPETCRASVMNILRVPLNLIVVLLMANVHSLHSHTVFKLASGALCVALLCKRALFRLMSQDSECDNSGDLRLEL